MLAAITRSDSSTSGTNPPFEEQVARGISAHDQLGIDDELGSLRDQGGVSLEDSTAIAGKIADGGVELGETDAHGRWRKRANVNAFAPSDNSQAGGIDQRSCPNFRLKPAW